MWLTHDSWTREDIWERADNRQFLANVIRAIAGEPHDQTKPLLFIQSGDTGSLAESMGYRVEEEESVPENLQEYQALFCYFPSFGNSGFPQAQVERLQAYLAEGGTMLAFGIGWVYETYGAGRSGVFGWDPMVETLRRFDGLPSPPSDDGEVMDLWVRFYSLSSGWNLIEPEALLEGLLSWLPKDELFAGSDREETRRL